MTEVYTLICFTTVLVHIKYKHINWVSLIIPGDSYCKASNFISKSILTLEEEYYY